MEDSNCEYWQPLATRENEFPIACCECEKCINFLNKQ